MYSKLTPQFHHSHGWTTVPVKTSSGISGHGSKLQMETFPPRFIIVCVLNNPEGLGALDLLREMAPQHGLIWVGTLANELSRAGVRGWELADELPHRFALLQIEEGTEAAALGEIYRLECNLRRGGPSKPFVAVEPDYPLELFIPSKIGSNYDLYDVTSTGSRHSKYCDLLKVTDAYNSGVKGGGTTVAVVDTGIDKSGIASSFQDLKDANNAVETDANGHGTAMASIIRDVAPDATVVAIRVSDGITPMWKLMQGISAASFQHKADIINISNGLDSIPTQCRKCGRASPGLSANLQNFLDDISKLGVGPNGAPLLLSSTGNGARSDGYCYPAYWGFTIAVGAVNSSMARSRFSNYWNASTHPSFIVMPGGDDDSSDTPTEWVGKGDGAECLGTSPATAYASAVLALYFSDPDYQNSNRKTFLSQALNNCDSSFSGYNSDEHGKGFLPYVAK